jgi:hypothetical protein
MASTSNNLRITLIGTGEQAGVWGNTTNTNLGTLLEQAIVGFTPKTINSATEYLAVIDGASAEFRFANIRLIGAASAYYLFVPPYTKSYTMVNSCNYDAYIAVASTPNTTVPAQTFSATISGTTMVVASVSTGVLLSNGMTITDVSGSTVAAGTKIVSQVSGITGGAGTYTVSVSQSVGSATSMFASLRIPAGKAMTFFSTGTSIFESVNNIAGDLSVQGALSVSSNATFGGNGAFGGTGSLGTPVGTTSQRSGSGIRYNTTLSRYEGYDINASTWSTIGGGATGGGANQVFYENDQNITASYTIGANKNAMTTGPVTITSFAAEGSIAYNAAVPETILTINSSPAPIGSLYIGAVIVGSGVASGQSIAQFRSGTGGAGTYVLSSPQGNVSTTAITSDVVVTVPTTSNWVILG